AILARVLGAVAAVLGHVLAVILPVLARVLAVVVVVVPRVVVHVGAAVPAVGTVVVVVVHSGADHDAGGGPDHPGGRGLRAVVFLHDHGRRRGRRLGVDGGRVVLRDVDHLRVRRLDDDHLLPGRRRLRLDLLLLVALQCADALRLLAQLLNRREHRRAIGD